MKYFTIRDVENLCGIKAHTLRIWEQRYSFLKPMRKDSNRRIYDSDDLKSLLQVSFLYHKGYKISKIAALPAEEIRQLVEKSGGPDANHELFIHELIAAGVDLDKDKFEKITHTVVLRYGIDKCITGIFIPFLERIGMLWMTNHIIPAQEHFASHIIRKKIICATDGIENPAADAPCVLIFAPMGELHEIPLLIANYFFRKYGFRTVYFGINTSNECLQKYLTQHPVDYLYTHIISQINKEGTAGLIKWLGGHYPDVPVLASGGCMNCLESGNSQFTFFRTVDELVQFTKEKITLAVHSS
ncbi:MAG: MerR family transcriptional regulator [Chitinophagaceae bacterium]|nr:MerR family transcriptional regulator [Chitinophagaceae bacterium]